MISSFLQRRSCTDNQEQQKYKSYEDWCESNPSIYPFIERLKFRTKAQQLNFNAKRNGIHSRCIDSVLMQRGKIKAKLERLELQITSTQQINHKLGFIGYDSKSYNMDVRKYLHISRYIQLKEIELYSKEFVAFEEADSKCVAILDLYASKLIPDDEVNKVRESFFLLQNNAFISEEKELAAYRMYQQRLKQKILAFEKPLWKLDFKGFLFKISKKGYSLTESELGYFLPIEEEVYLSNALFSTPTKFGQMFDDYFEANFGKLDNEEFIYGMLLICVKMVPKSIKLDGQKTSLIMQLYRVAFARLYEKHGSAFISNDCYTVAKIEAMKSYDINRFSIPTELVGRPIEGTISSFFAADPIFKLASDMMSLSLLQCNPLDALYCVHMCLVMIQDGARRHRSSNRPSSEKNGNESKHIICFDDLFTLLLGTLMGTQFQDISFVSQFIINYSPKNNLSPALEYALANIEALALHCKKLESQESNGCKI